IYGFRAQGKTFVIVQNMWSTARTVKLHLDARTAMIAGDAVAVDLNGNVPLTVHGGAGAFDVDVPVGPWDAVLVMLGSAAKK
ncbi:MAG TPA: hypothetical protein VM186_11645, partial [Planctomycetota bacterium]|nr:hypothetical protein [Planctomycetota bacterium]